MSSEKPSTVVIGTGYWGINHVRNFAQLNALHGVYDASEARRQEIASKYEGVKAYASFEAVLEDPAVKGVVISSPAPSHYELTLQALQAGKDVLVEKPLALKASQAKELLDESKKLKRILMVGHLLRYHPAIAVLKELLNRGELGDLEYVYSNRLNLGKIRTEENILWSFAPHDISLMLWFTGSMPLQVNVMGGSYLTPNVADTTVSSFVFGQGIRGHIYVSWLHPFKEQRLVLIGKKKMAVFDDQAVKEQKLLLYEKQVRRVDDHFVTEKPKGLPIAYDMTAEPLREECKHFLSCMQTRQTPVTDAEEGLRVLQTLQACQRSLELNGQSVQVSENYV